MMRFLVAMEQVGQAMDIAGVAVIVIGIVLATLTFLQDFRSSTEAHKHYRQSVGRAILLGLELLVAADIIRTVAITPSFRSVGILAVIVVIRTFLSWSLELELEGRWPWQQKVEEKSSRDKTQKPEEKLSHAA
jgi:uncharacterized membrane protein